MLNRKQADAFFARSGFDPVRGRQVMDAMRSRGMKIKKQLEAEGRYNPLDDTLIETLAMAVEVRDRSFMVIDREGVLMYVDHRKKVRQKNHAISAFSQMEKVIAEISRRLGLSPYDRYMLKIEDMQNDGLDD